MRVGLIGVGVVGGTLRDWFKEHTPQHEVALYDPAKGHTESLEGCVAIFIAVPVPSSALGQNEAALCQAVELAKKYTEFVFIRSTVLPGTNDRFQTFSMPEFLTERTAYEDFCKMPLLLGVSKAINEGQSNKKEVFEKLIEILFPGKEKIYFSNTEAELSKLAHNCFGAMKVSYFNIIKDLSDRFGAKYENVKKGALLTGFISPHHTQVPGPDGQRGYGGKCFPENMSAMRGLFRTLRWNFEQRQFFESIILLNTYNRKKP